MSLTWIFATFVNKQPNLEGNCLEEMKNKMDSKPAGNRFILEQMASISLSFANIATIGSNKMSSCRL